jgi:hypothetical protein
VNKNLKLALFVIGATVFNLVLMLIIWLGGSAGTIALVNLAFGEAAVGKSGFVITVVWFIASIVLTFLIYGKTAKWLQKKYNLEQHFPQWFGKKR